MSGPMSDLRHDMASPPRLQSQSQSATPVRQPGTVDCKAHSLCVAAGVERHVAGGARRPGKV